MLSSRNYKSPFTPSQWIELENQGLIFKYMVSGLPIPPQLISSLKTSLLDYSPSNSIMPPTPPTYGLQMGFDRRRRRRSADPDEPAERCRRTDGKKWRCSKEAANPDSKYCERHMHRGRNRNRSRKPVELISTSNSDSLSSITTPTSSNYSLSSTSTSPITTPTPTPTLSSSSSLFSSEAILPQQHHHPFLYPSFSTPLNYNINAHHHLLFDSASYSYHPDQYYRYGHGMRPFSPEVSENVPSQLPNSYLPLTMSSSKGYSDLTFECLTENSKHDQKKQQQEEEKDQQHCYVLGTDFKSPPRPIKVERGERNQKPFHHFLGESKDSFWLNIEENQSNHTSFSTTQLSIFKSLSTKELFASKSKFITDG